MGDSITLLDAEGNTAAYMNVEEVRDAAGKASLYNRIDIAPYGDGGQYIVTVTLDEAFLTAPDTVYPLRAAAQISIGSSYINDTDVNTMNPGGNYAGSTTLWTGYINGAKYRSYLQFIFGDYMYTIRPGNVTSAYLNLYEISGNTSTFTLQSRIPDNIWSYTSLTWNNQPGLLGSFNGINAPSQKTLTTTNTVYNIDCSTFIKACMLNYWDTSLPYTIHEERGITLKIANESSAQLRSFCSSNHGTSSWRPVVVVNYKTTGMGTASSYRPKGQGGPNCWGYALEQPNTHEPILASNSATLQQIKDFVKAQSSNFAYVRELDGKDDYVYPYEYRIAFRMTRWQENTSSGLQSYHFMVQLNSGTWAHKIGSSSSAFLGWVDPDVDSSIYWDTLNGSSSKPTLYFAVDPKHR